MTEDLLAPPYDVYVCPACMGQLEGQFQSLFCPLCRVEYPISGGVPDFLPAGRYGRRDGRARWIERTYDRLAHATENPRWPLLLALYGGRAAPTFQRMIQFYRDEIAITHGLILDVGCGPGTIARRLAAPEVRVYGMDVSWGALHQGQRYLEREAIENVHFGRARAEALPLRSAAFDGAVCNAILHQVSDPLVALREVARTVKPGALFAGLTLVYPERGLISARRLRAVAARRGYNVFEAGEVAGLLAQVGFVGAKISVYNALLTFSAIRGYP